MKKTCLIVSADDFGISPGVNRGIEEAHRNGIVTNTSVVPCGAWFSDAAAVKKRNPGLGMGIHLALVAEKPLLPPGRTATLVGEDLRFHKNHAVFIRRLAAGRISAPEVRAELSAQIEAFLDAGIRPSHVDSHQHVHVLPPVRDIVMELCGKYRIGRVRVPGMFPMRLPVNPFAGRSWKLWLLALLSGRLRGRLKAAGLSSPDYCAGIERSGSLTEEDVLRYVLSLPPGTTELVCHAGYADEAVLSGYGWGNWERELSALCSPRVKDLIRERGVELLSYDRL